MGNLKLYQLRTHTAYFFDMHECYKNVTTCIELRISAMYNTDIFLEFAVGTHFAFSYICKNVFLPSY